MKKRLKLNLLVIGLVMSVTTMAQSQWIPFTKNQPSDPTVNVTVNTNQTVSFEVEIGGMYRSDITEGGTTYSRLVIADAASENASGAPEVPVLKYMVAVPECSNVTLTYNVLSQNNLKGYTVYPVPTYVPVENPNGAVYVDEQFTLNPEAYSINQFYGATPSEVSSEGHFRAQRYIEVRVNPLAYNPVTKQLKVNERIAITLQFDNPVSDINQNTGIFNAVAANTFINYQANGMNALINDRASTSGSVQYITLTDTLQAGQIVADYLIIADDMFIYPRDSNLTKIAQHRADYNGFDVAILDVENIISVFQKLEDPIEHAAPKAIRRFIRDVYNGNNAHHTRDNKLGYVLLVGDVYENNTGVPMSQDHTVLAPHSGEELVPYPTDYYYSCVTHIGEVYDDRGDLFIGRFSVQDSTQLSNMVTKTIFYETEYTFEDWRNSICFVNDIGKSPESWQNYYSYVESIIDSSINLKIANRHVEGDNLAEKVFEHINSGIFYLHFNGHGDRNRWTNLPDLKIENFETNLINNYKTPFISTISCNTGGYDNYDCLAEFLTRYSDTIGAVGYIGASRVILSTDVTKRLFPHYIFSAKSSITGEFLLHAKLHYSGANASIKFGLNLFGDPALNIMAQGYKITRDTELNASVPSLSTDITVCAGATLTIDSKYIRFNNMGNITVNDGATLKLKNDVVFEGFNSSNFIKINGKLSVEGNVYLRTKNSNMFWQGLILDNPNIDFVLNNIRFSNCGFNGNTKSLSLYNCRFNNANINTGSDILTLEKSYFTNSPIYATNFAGCKSSMVNIIDCNFNVTDESKSAINIESYSNLIIKGNIIIATQSDGDGISISNGGWGAISNNISNNRISGFNYGIKLFRSSVHIDGRSFDYDKQNIITNNNYGLGCFNGSSIILNGNPEANIEDETQRIFNNHINQVFVTDNSFPVQFQYNAIYGNEPHYVYYLGLLSSQSQFRVAENYWGAKFDPEIAFFPHNAYKYEPIWEIKPSTNTKTDVEVLYSEAETQLKNGNYEIAEMQFKNIVAQYPEDQLALESLKQLMVIYNATTLNYTELNTYYLQVAIANESENDDEEETAITKLSNDLANYCMILDENYTLAIAYLNEKLNSDDNTERIFAAIDLAYIDQLIENSNSGKSAQDQNYTNIAKYIDYKDEMLRKLSSSANNIQEDILQVGLGSDNMIISPNPTRLTLNVRYTTDLEYSNVQIKIFDLLGTECLYKQINNVEKGTHDFTLNTSEFSSGIYIVRLYVNGTACCSQKLIISE